MGCPTSLQILPLSSHPQNTRISFCLVHDGFVIHLPLLLRLYLPVFMPSQVMKGCPASGLSQSSSRPNLLSALLVITHNGIIAHFLCDTLSFRTTFLSNYRLQSTYPQKNSTLQTDEPTTCSKAYETDSFHHKLREYKKNCSIRIF